MNPQLQLILQQAIQAFQGGDFVSADLSLRRVLQIDSKNLPALHILGLIKASQSNFREAVDYLSRAARIHPNDASIQYNLAKALADSGNDKDALAHHKMAITLAPNNPEAWLSYGKSASNLGRHEDALVWYGNALSLKPDYAEALLNKGATLKELKRYEEAITFAKQAISINPNWAEAWSNKGGALKELKRFDEAIAHYDKALSLKPDYAEGWFNKGVTLHELRQYNEAIAHFDKALSLKPDYHEAWTNKGATFHELRQYNEAIAHFDKALSLKPDYHEAWTNKGATFHELRQYNEAIAHFDKALSLKPDYHEAWANKATSLNGLKNHSQSAKCYLKAFELRVEDNYLLGQAHHQMMLICDWTNYEKISNQISNEIFLGNKSAEPFGYQGIAKSEELLKKCAEIYSNDRFPSLANLAQHYKYQNKRIRIGYLCGEFREQATSILMTRIWELHDKSKFEIFAFDNGWSDESEYRQRIEGAFKSIFDISQLSDVDAANLIQSNQIDILVNLNGYFGRARQGIFSYKPALIQVNYLGFPGTLGAKYIDYIIADNIVIPQDSRRHYVEKIAYLPNSYQANDNQRKVSNRKFTKSELDLPENSFVFACFNNNYKITPATFDLWSRILKKVENSVLWLLADNPTAKKNLIKEASNRGIDSTRLVFAERLEHTEHLARHRLADIFLDALPYNAHTTCSDALWSGLPVLTLKGRTFPGRVSASLLNAVGLDDLVTHSEEEYEFLAIELANDRARLEAIRERLAANILSRPLFDSDLFTEKIETAFMKMYERSQADLEPDYIFVS